MRLVQGQTTNEAQTQRQNPSLLVPSHGPSLPRPTFTLILFPGVESRRLQGRIWLFKTIFHFQEEGSLFSEQEPKPLEVTLGEGRVLSREILMAQDKGDLQGEGSQSAETITWKAESSEACF